jgi:DNA-nicking Smr family endonuclease
VKKDDFKYQKEDLSFWRSQTKDLKNQPKLEKHTNVISEDDLERDFLELKAGKEELLSFRKVLKESLEPLPDLTLEKNSAGIDKNTNHKFKTGRMPIQAKLDMHGMTQKVAFDALVNFINNSFEQGKRCVVVVTGKGFMSKNRGILKQSLPIWINNEDIRPKILSFCQATIKDGGGGAYYVFLKKKK